MSSNEHCIAFSIWCTGHVIVFTLLLFFVFVIHVFFPCFCFNQHIRPLVSRNFGFIGQLQSPLLLPFPTSISIFCCVHVRDSLSVVVVSAFLILTFHFCMRFRLYLIHSIKSYMCYHLLCGRFFSALLGLN